MAAAIDGASEARRRDYVPREEDRLGASEGGHLRGSKAD